MVKESDLRLLIRRAQVNSSKAIYAHELKELFLSTEGMILLILFRIQCLVVHFDLLKGLAPLQKEEISLTGIFERGIIIILPTKINLLFAI